MKIKNSIYTSKNLEELAKEIEKSLEKKRKKTFYSKLSKLFSRRNRVKEIKTIRIKF